MRFDLDAPVVVADAEPVSALFLAEILGGAGISTEVTDDVVGILDLVSAGRPPAAVVLVAPLPGTSLATALSLIASATPSSLRLVLVDADGAAARIAALEAGADAVLALPVHPGELRAVLGALLRRAVAPEVV